jgi:superfamily II DNA or RNA helicase
MWISVENAQSRVFRATDEELSWLAGYLTLEDANARFMKGDGKIHLLSSVGHSFPSGFLPLVRKASPFLVEVADARTKPCERDVTADLAWLRDYQLEGVERSIAAERGVLWCPTGSGKTEIAVGLALALPCRWLFAVHRATLMHQAADRYEQRTGLKAGRIGEGIWSVERFTAATFQTLFARMRSPEGVALLSGAQGLVVDEVHSVPASTFYRVAMRTVGAYWRIGMSGTPLARGDRKSIYTIAATGPVIYRIKPDVLIEAGVLARPHIRFVPVVQSSDGNDWHAVYRECIVESPARNAVVVALARKAAKPCLVFVKEIDHGKLLLQGLTAAGLRAEFVWGDKMTAQRKASIKRLVRGDIDALVASVVFQEGVDIPSLASVVIASGGRSVIATLQRIGRGMRTDDGRKAGFDVWDIADRGCRWLDKHTRERAKAYAGEGYETTVVDAPVRQLQLPRKTRQTA